MNFHEFKDEILRRDKEASACATEYRRLLQSNNFSELMRVIKDNFGFACEKKVIDSSLIEAYKEEFNKNQIYCNVDISTWEDLVRYLLVSGSATVKVCNSGRVTVEAFDNATVKVDELCVIVRAHDSVTVNVLSGVIKAWDDVSVNASGGIIEAWDNVTVKASGDATVEASGDAYVTSYLIIDCKLSENAIYRLREYNKIRYAGDDIKFKKLNTI
jgi:hypothetical protein